MPATPVIGISLLAASGCSKTDKDKASEAFERGNDLAQKQDYDNAIAEYIEAIRLNPEHGEAYCNRGVCYFKKGEHDKALADLPEALRINPKDPTAFTNIGLVKTDRELTKLQKDLRPLLPNNGETEAGKNVAADQRRAVNALCKRHPGLNYGGFKFNERNEVISVALGFKEISDEDMDWLTTLTTLKWINLENARGINDSKLEKLKGLPELEALDFTNTGVTDAGLAHLSGINRLVNLSLYQTQVTDAGLQHLKGLTNLRMLWLVYTKVKGPGLENLKGMRNLEVLSLSGTEVDDEGLSHLKGLTGLKEVIVNNCKNITDAGVAQLQVSLPECKIVRD